MTKTMEARQLRIGNLIYHNSKYGKHMFEIKGIISDHMFEIKGIISDVDKKHTTSLRFYNPGGLTYPKLNECEPIPLTEEWLLKFGFNTWYGNIYVNDIQLFFDEGEYYYNTTKIKYVHHLQNLYFALTGKELEIK